jgi:uncharacterized Zn-binding protein involved in type VI secretion
MFGRFGTALLGTTEFLRRLFGQSRRISCVGDGASHSGSITISGQSTPTLFAAGLEVAINGAVFNCSDHGPQTIYPVISKTFCEGKLLITDGAITGCGAKISSPDRKIYAG